MSLYNITYIIILCTIFYGRIVSPLKSDLTAGNSKDNSVYNIRYVWQGSNIVQIKHKIDAHSLNIYS